MFLVFRLFLYVFGFFLGTLLLFVWFLVSPYVFLVIYRSLSGPFNIGSTKPSLFWAIGQKAQVNLVTCTNFELMAGSQYPQTTRSLLKTGVLLMHYITVFLFSR